MQTQKQKTRRRQSGTGVSGPVFSWFYKAPASRNKSALGAEFSKMAPGIDQREATTLEVADIARCELVATMQRDGGDLCIELRDRAAGPAPRADHIDIGRH